MERYGWMTTKHDCCGDIGTGKKLIITGIQHRFFKNLENCIRNARIQSYAVGMEERNHHYLKILKTSDVVQHIHDLGRDHAYGYIYLSSKKETNFEKISLLNYGNLLFTSMLDCVSAQKGDTPKTPTEDQCDIKIAYFVLLNDEDLLDELHKPTV